MLHILIVLSLDPLATVKSSGDNATEFINPLCSYERDKKVILYYYYFLKYLLILNDLHRKILIIALL